MKFSDLLKETRERLGLTQWESAARIGCSLRGYAYWESGGKTPHPLTQESILSRIAKSKRPCKHS